MVSAAESSTSHGCLAAYPWSERLNEGPGVRIPLPNLDYSNGQPSMTVKHSTSMDYDCNQFGNPAFLNALITNGSVTLTHTMLDWKYEHRRQAQMVLPFLYLGPLSAAKDKKFVSETGFTLLMSIRSMASGPAHAIDAAKMTVHHHGVRAYNLDVDWPTYLIRIFPAGIKVINDHLEDTTNAHEFSVHENFRSGSIRGKVLIFCETGNDRSAAFVTAYLMAVFNVDVVTAIQIVQSQRFSICFDEPTRSALATFETLLAAKRDVGRANRTLNGDQRTRNLQPEAHQQFANPAPPKRTLGNVYDDEDEMETHGGERHQRRMAEAPFYDAKG